MIRRGLVIADDLTGAAEIAGIGHRFGLATRLLRKPATAPGDDSNEGLLVLDTDSRSQRPADAAETVRRFVDRLREQPFDLIFKKTDSALRGPVLAEVQSLATAFAKTGALLVPQNPSRGRTIRGSRYYIDLMP